ncbi:NUDIX domain-containing protein [Lapidilactobacillus wuchangensis]|uniref:NUDIX domain-containing protein n=1 Tax=Lapidilactobacillus wuchangensis TaxID=2486001 RepID=UPI0013DE536C|nr:NUDIX domain-containing protein [Lapidilactobacillus wuchangensis]
MSYVTDLRALIGHQPLILNGSCVLLFNAQQQLLLQQRAEPQARWGLLGGLMELGESTRDVVLREVQEESDLILETDKLQFINTYSGPDHRAVAPNGDIFYSVISAYAYQPVTEQPQVNDQESQQFQWYALTDLPTNLVASHRQIIQDYCAAQQIDLHKN